MLLLSILLIPLLATLAIPFTSIADHESDNELTFEPAPDSVASSATGTGRIEFRGGVEPESR